MSGIDKSGDRDFDICWGRGDSDGKTFTVTDSAGAAVNIAGSTFKLTVNTDLAPADAVDQVFTVAGTITDAAAGKVEFAPTAVQTDVTPGVYFYDIEWTAGTGRIKTLVKGVCLIVQDISK